MSKITFAISDFFKGYFSSDAKNRYKIASKKISLLPREDNKHFLNDAMQIVFAAYLPKRQFNKIWKEIFCL